MAQLPLKLPFDQHETRWKAILDPVIATPMVAVKILEGVSLANGVTSVNHLLGRKQQGWFITDVNGIANIYRSSPLNDKSLTLTSDAAVVVNIGVF